MSNTSSPLKLAWRIGIPRYEADNEDTHVLPQTRRDSI